MFLQVHTLHVAWWWIYLRLQPRLFPSCASSMYWLDYRQSRPLRHDIDLRPYSLIILREVYTRLHLYLAHTPLSVSWHKEKRQASRTTWTTLNGNDLSIWFCVAIITWLTGSALTIALTQRAVNKKRGQTSCIFKDNKQERRRLLSLPLHLYHQP